MVVVEDARHEEDGGHEEDGDLDHGHEEGAVHAKGVYPVVLKVKQQLRLHVPSRPMHPHLPFDSSSLPDPGPTGHCSSLESEPGLCCGLCCGFPCSNPDPH